MAEVVSKDVNKFIGKKFLNTNIVRFFSPEQQNTHAVHSINGYVSRNYKSVDNTSLQIEGLEGGSIDLEDFGIVAGDNLYYPVWLNFTYRDERKRLRSCRIKGCVYITEAKRPDVGHILEKIGTLLKSNYGGVGYHFKLDRYVICLDKLSPGYLSTLLHLAKTGDCSVVDHSWIAPLQDILEVKGEKKSKPIPKKSSFLEEEDSEETLRPKLRDYEQELEFQSRKRQIQEEIRLSQASKKVSRKQNPTSAFPWAFAAPTFNDSSEPIAPIQYGTSGQSIETSPEPVPGKYYTYTLDQETGRISRAMMDAVREAAQTVNQNSNPTNF